MENSQRDKFVADIERIKKALSITTSEYLKRDYQKALKRKYRELKQYDRLQKQSRATE